MHIIIEQCLLVVIVIVLEDVILLVFTVFINCFVEVTVLEGIAEIDSMNRNGYTSTVYCI